MTLNRYGIIIRIYTPNPEEVPDRIERALKHAMKMRMEAQHVWPLSHIMFVVPSDYDCGQTCSTLDAALEKSVSMHQRQVSVSSFPGHHSCEALNHAVRVLRDHGAERLVIVSGKAVESYFIAPVLQEIDAKFSAGATVVGVAVDELRDIIHDGRVQNTFAAYDLTKIEEGDLFDSATGVEEMAPLIRFARLGRKIGIVDLGAGELAIHDDATSQARHAEVMKTKIARQQAECDRLGSSFEEIRAAVLCNRRSDPAVFLNHMKSVIVTTLLCRKSASSGRDSSVRVTPMILRSAGMTWYGTRLSRSTRRTRRRSRNAMLFLSR